MITTNRPEILAHPLVAAGLIALLLTGIGCATGSEQNRETSVNGSVTGDQSQRNASGDDLAEAFYDPFLEDPFAEENGVEVYDPWESFNSSMFSFNQKADRYVFKPIATGYDWIMPDPVEHAISRAFHNLGFVPRLLNNVLQGKMNGARTETTRFLLNNTFGITDLFNITNN